MDALWKVLIDCNASAVADSIEVDFSKEYKGLPDTKKKRLLAYMNMLQNMKE